MTDARRATFPHLLPPSNADARDQAHRAPEFTDEALALQFADNFQDKLRYCASWSKWLLWTGNRWRVDDVLQARKLARDVARSMSSRCTDPHKAVRLASAKTVVAVEHLAKADHRLAATNDQWDADPWLLNTPGGVVDLKSGTLRPHDPADHMTKITSATPGGDCPTWHRFLNDVTAGNVEFQTFIQRLAGYALTGNTSEHALFFVYGSGANGKSVMIDTFARILGDYHTTAPIETFTASAFERHPTDLAGLRGARLVTAVETESGRRWAESRIKSVTGGDRISARFMRCDFFEFDPQFKLLFAGNHKPGLASVDEAIRRRVNILPFTVTIPPDQRDRQLTVKLEAELSGILRWMIEGCLDWQAHGLGVPGVVRTATAEYLDAEDTLATWINDCCLRDPRASASSSELFASWSSWAKTMGEPAITRKRFGQDLDAHGFARTRNAANRGYQGLSLKAIRGERSRSRDRWPIE